MLTTGLLRLEAITAIHRTISRRLKWNFGSLTAAGAGCREHLARTARGITPATTTAATGTRITAATTAAAATTTFTLLGFALISAGFATLGFVCEATFGKALLLISRERELGAAIDAHNCFVFVRHKGLPGYFQLLRKK